MLKPVGTDVLKGLIFASLGFFIFSSGDALAKYLSSSYSVPQLIFWAQISALIMLCGISIVKEKTLEKGIKSLVVSPAFRLHILRGSILGIQVYFTFYAFSQIPLSQAYTLIFCAPLFASLISRLWLKETVTLKSWIVLLVGFSGILIILRPGFGALDIEMLLPLLSALFSGFLFAFGHVAGRRLDSHDSPLMLGFYPASFGLIYGGIYMALSGENFVPGTPADALMMVLLGIASIGGLLFVTWAFRVGPVPVVSSFHYTQLIWGTLFGVIFFGDKADIWTWIGAVPIVGSGLYLTWMQRRPPYPATKYK